MEVIQDRKIVIKLPKIKIQSLFILGSFFMALAVFAYWYKAIRPWVWREGKLEAMTTVLSSDIEGRIVELKVKEGDLVKKGEPLFVLDRDFILAKRNRAKLSLQTLENQISLEKERMGKAMEDYLKAMHDLDQGIGNPDTIQKQLVQMQQAQERAELAKEELASAKAESDLIEIQIQKMTISAPYDGVILKCCKTVGSVVAFGEPVYIFCDPNHLWLDVEIPEKKLEMIAKGTEAKIRFSSHLNQTFTGKVEWISPATVAKSSLQFFKEKEDQVALKVSMDPTAIHLRPGLSAQVGLKVR